MGRPLKVLMVEDSEDDSELLLHELRRGGFDPAWKRVETEDALRAALEEDAWDIVTSDYEMPHLSAPKALEVLKESGRDVPFIVVSGVISMERAVELMKGGAHDFVEKNDLARLVPAVERGLRLAEEHRGRKRAEQALRASEERFRTLIDGSSQGILVHRNLRILYVNQSLVEMFGYDSADEILALESREVMTAQRARLLGYHKARLRGETAPVDTAPVDYEYEGLRKDGAKIWLENRSFRIEWEGGPAICTTLFDITERKRAEADIKHLALHDSLTDLPNRFLFHDRLRTAVAQVERTGGTLALLFLDLDDFKDVNDTLGHAAGDELLKAVAERLRSYLRESDTVGRHNTTLARLGGDEFTILLTNLTDPVGAATVAERIIDDMARPFSVGANVIHTSACIGIGIYPTHGGTPEELLKKADLALYLSKAEGRNKYHFYNDQM